MIERLRKIVLHQDTLGGQLFDVFIQIVIVVSLLSYSFYTIPNQTTEFYLLLDAIELITVIIFTIEYLLRIWLEPNRLKFIFSFFGLVDFIAIIPFYISGMDFRSLRALRLLRVFKFFRYSKTIQRMHLALHLARKELNLFFFLTCILLYLAAVGIYHFENPVQPEVFSSIFESLWWAVATLTTVGYGDVVPITVGGKIFTFLILMIGLGIVAIPAGIVASAVTRAREIVNEQESKNQPKGDSKKNPVQDRINDSD